VLTNKSTPDQHNDVEKVAVELFKDKDTGEYEGDIIPPRQQTKLADTRPEKLESPKNYHPQEATIPPTPTATTEEVESELQGSLIEPTQEPSGSNEDIIDQEPPEPHDIYEDVDDQTQRVYIPIRLIPQIVDWNNANIETHRMNLVDIVTNEVVSEFDMPYLSQVSATDDTNPDIPPILCGRVIDSNLIVLYVSDDDVVCTNDINGTPTMFIFPEIILDDTRDVILALDYGEKMDLLMSLGFVPSTQPNMYEEPNDEQYDDSDMMSSISGDISAFINM